MAAFRQELLGWQGQLGELKLTLARDETRLERRQAEVDETCRRYGVFEDDWYRLVKQELCKRKVIGTDLVAEERA